MDREAWQATVHGVAKSWTQLSDFYFHFQGTCQPHYQFLQDGDRGGNCLVVEWGGGVVQGAMDMPSPHLRMPL